MKKRQSSFELLRIIAMCMIITRHYITKGGVVSELYDDLSLRNTLWYLLDAFCLVCCNVYILISGYFMVDSEWKISKLINLICQVLFYSILVPVVLGLTGIINLSELTVGEILTCVFPIGQAHYWFATAYVGLYLISPLLVAAVNNISQDRLRIVIIGLVVMYGGIKSVYPYYVPGDRYGEDVVWFICLFLIAAYIKKYGLGRFESKGICLLTYVISTLLVFAICYICAVIASRTGSLGYCMDMTYCNNYILVLVASIALFGVFKNIDITSVFINKLGGYTFGIYLLHNHNLIAYEWQKWLGIDVAQGKWYQPIHWIFCLLIVYIVGTIIDIARKSIFKLVSNKNV